MQLGPAWLVRSNETADDLRDRLCAGLPPEDGMLVLEIGEQGAWRGVTEEQGEWLVSNIWATRCSRVTVISV
jgi:hypothetical protein